MNKIEDYDVSCNRALLWDALDDRGNLLLRKGTVPKTIAQINLLVRNGYYKGVPTKPPGTQEHDENETELAEDESTLDLQHLDERFVLTGWNKKDAHRYAISSVEDAVKKLDPLLSNIIRGAPDKRLPQELLDVADALHRAVKLNTDACLVSLFFHRGRAEKNYRVRHVVDTAMIAIILAIKQGFSRRDIARIVAAAFTMNVGMWSVQNRLATQSEPLDDTDKKNISEHPLKSVELLKKAGIKDTTWHEEVLCHHEKQDGSGYPLGLAGNDILPGAQIIGLADRFTALLVTRGTRDSIPPGQALKLLLMTEGETIEADLFGLLTKSVGLYPPGCFVRLLNGETAIVVRTGQDGKPYATSFLDVDNGSMAIPIQRDTAEKQYAILGPVTLQEDEIPLIVKKVLDMSY